MGKTLNYLGIARKSGNLELGEDNARDLIKAGKARLLLIASDTSEHARRRAEGYVFGFNTPLVDVPFSKADIAQAVGRTGCSMVAVRDLGLARSIAQALAAEFGEDYAPLAEALTAKLEKAKVRKAKGKKTGDRRTSE